MRVPAPDSPRGIAGLRRHLLRPGVSLVLLIGCLLDLFTLAPGFEYRQTGSRIANAIGSLRSPALRSDPSLPPSGPSAYIAWFADSDELRVITREQADSTPWAILFDVYSIHYSAYEGWWGLTHHSRGFSWAYDISSAPGSPPAPPGLSDRVNEAFAGYVRSLGDPGWNRELARATKNGASHYNETVPRWSGWLRDAVSAPLWLLWVVSLGWIVPPLRTRRRWRLIGRGLCPVCRYQIGPDGASRPCPECGHVEPARDHVGEKPLHAPRRVGRFILSPWCTSACTLLLTIDALTLPKSKRSGVQSGSRVGNVLPTPALVVDPGDGRPDARLEMAVYLYEDGPEFRVVTDERSVLDAPCRFAIVHESFSRGFWAPVRTYTYSNYGGSGWENLPAILRDHFSEILVAHLEAAGMDNWADDVRRRELTSGYLGTSRWGGHLHNAASMGVALTLIVSVGWIPRLVAARRARLCRSAGRCPFCRAPAEMDRACGVCGEPASL